MSIDTVDRSSVFATPVVWAEYAKSGSDALFLTRDDVRAIRELDDDNPEAMVEILEEDEEAGEAFANALIKVAANVSDVDALRRALTLMEDLLDDVDMAVVESRVAFFRSHARTKPANVAPVVRLITSCTDDYVVAKAARCSAFLMCANPIDESVAKQFSTWICQSLAASTSRAVTGVDLAPATLAALSALTVFTRNAAVGSFLFERSVIDCLTPFLKSPSTKIRYDTCFSLWLLSLDPEAGVLMDRAGAVEGLANVCNLDAPLKVTRVAIAALLTISKSASSSDTTLATMAETSLPSVLEQVFDDERDIKDAEMRSDASELAERLRNNLRVLSSWERYTREVEGGSLRWSPLHTAEFFKENIRKMEDKNFAVVRQLSTLLSSVSDPNTLSVACFDIGEFARLHPHGRLIVDKLHLKAKVMALLERKDEDVELKRNALLCCSKLMVSRWEFVGRK